MCNLSVSPCRKHIGRPQISPNRSAILDALPWPDALHRTSRKPRGQSWCWWHPTVFASPERQRVGRLTHSNGHCIPKVWKHFYQSWHLKHLSQQDSVDLPPEHHTFKGPIEIIIPHLLPRSLPQTVNSKFLPAKPKPRAIAKLCLKPEPWKPTSKAKNATILAILEHPQQ